MKHDSKVRFNQGDPLNEQDTLAQTLGCRHSNPDICNANSLSGVCAFVTSDKICRKPPKSWPKLFKKLNGEIK